MRCLLIINMQYRMRSHAQLDSKLCRSRTDNAVMYMPKYVMCVQCVCHNSVAVTDPHGLQFPCHVRSPLIPIFFSTYSRTNAAEHLTQLPLQRPVNSRHCRRIRDTSRPNRRLRRPRRQSIAKHSATQHTQAPHDAPTTTTIEHYVRVTSVNNCRSRTRRCRRRRIDRCNGG